LKHEKKKKVTKNETLKYYKGQIVILRARVKRMFLDKDSVGNLRWLQDYNCQGNYAAASFQESRQTG